MKIEIQALKDALNEAELDCSIDVGTPEAPLQQVILPLGPNDDGDELTMQIALMKQQDVENPEDETLQLQFVQFLVMMPTTVPEEKIQESIRLLHILNTIAELPGFGFLESEKLPLFRYSLLCNNDTIDKSLFIMTVGLVIYIVDTYSDVIVNHSKGRLELSELLKGTGLKDHL